MIHLIFYFLKLFFIFLMTSQVIRHYHGHLSACYSLALHPALDILVSTGRDSVARVNINFIYAIFFLIIN